MTHLFPTAQLKNRGVEAQGHTFFYIIFYLYVLLNQIRIITYLQRIDNDWEEEEGKKKKKKSFFFFFFFFLGHKIYWVGSFLSGRSGYRKQ